MTASRAPGVARRRQLTLGTGAWPCSSVACDTYESCISGGDSVMVPAIGVSGLGALPNMSTGSPALAVAVAKPDGQGVHGQQQHQQHDAGSGSVVTEGLLGAAGPVEDLDRQDRERAEDA